MATDSSDRTRKQGEGTGRNRWRQMIPQEGEEMERCRCLSRERGIGRRGIRKGKKTGERKRERSSSVMS